MNLSVTPVTRVEIELTEACDLQCRFCYNSRAPSQSDCVLQVFDALVAARVLEVALTGGEPSLHPDFLSLLDAAVARFPRVMVQSNGVRFATGSLLSELARRRIFCVNFSLHGSDTVHDGLTRTPGSFAKTIRALRDAVEAGLRVASNLVLTSLNREPAVLSATVEALHGAGVREMTVTRFVPCGLGREAWSLALSAGQFHRALAHLHAATEERKMSLLLANSAPLCKMPSNLQPLVNRCSFGFDKFYVDVHGNLLVCGMTRSSLGNLLHTPLMDLLSQSPLCANYRMNLHVPTACRDCADLAVCGGGCRAAALAADGVLEGMDPLSFARC